MSASLSNPNAPDSYADWPQDMQHAASVTPKVTDKHVFFFGHIGPTSTLNCLSPWHPCAFSGPSYHPSSPLDDNNASQGADEPRQQQQQQQHRFATFEHYMMHPKAVLMKDSAIAVEMLDANTTAKQVKALGRQVANYDGELWLQHREEVVFRGNLLKFRQNAEAARTLLEQTGDRDIVEASPEDRIWGIGFAADVAEGEEKGWGLNLMGKALMRVRVELTKGS